MVSKLNLDLEKLQPKYDRVFPEIFRAMEHVNNAEVREQLECLLSDVYSTFLQPDVEAQKSRQQPSQFLEIIKRAIQSSPGISTRKIIDATNLKKIHKRASSKLNQARAFHQQVEQLDAYFNGLLATLPELETERNDSTSSANPRSKSCAGEPVRPAAGHSTSSKLVWSALKKAKQGATANPSSDQGVELYSSDRGDSIFGSLQDQIGSQLTAQDSRAGETALDERQLLHNLLGRGRGDKGDDPSEKRRNSLCRRARSIRKFVQETDRIKWIAESVMEFQLNLPPRYLVDSAAFSPISNSEVSKDSNPCREATHSTRDSAYPAGCPGVNNDQLSPAGGQLNQCSLYTSDSGEAICQKALSILYGYPRSTSVGDTEGFSQSPCGKINPKLSGLVKEVLNVGLSLQERKTRVGALRKSNAVLREHISEAEGTLESFDKYLVSVKDKPSPVPLETIQREMYAFQEVMIERIFSCIELLSVEMKYLRKTDQAKGAKLKALLARYEETKRETPDDSLTFGGSKKKPATPPPRTPAQKVNAELRKCLKAVVTGIECFHTSCEDIWEETVTRIFSELDTLFMSMPSPPTQMWRPDNPCPASHLSLAALDDLEEDIRSVNTLPKDKSKYGALVILCLRILERISSEFSHLMVVTRIKDLQIISIDHCIGMAYMSMRQMALPRVQKSPNCTRRAENKRKLWKSHKNDKKRKVQNTNEANQPRLFEMTAHKETLTKGRTSNTNVEMKPKNPIAKIQEIMVKAATAPVTNKCVYFEQLQAGDPPQHKRTAADIKLPLIHLDDCPQLPESASGLSPWSQTEDCDRSYQTQKTTRGASTHPTHIVNPKKNKMNFPKILTVANQNSSKSSAVNSGTTVKFIQETLEVCDEKNESSTYACKKVQSHESHRPIQYCRFLAAPIPPSSTLISGEGSAEGQKQTQRKLPRRSRFRLTSSDLRARDRTDSQDRTGMPDDHHD